MEDKRKDMEMVVDEVGKLGMKLASLAVQKREW